MTHETDSISTIIADIDSILQKASSRRPWLRSVDVQEQRRLLEQVRNYLAAQQQSNAVVEEQHLQRSQETGRQIVQAVEKEMHSLRSGLIGPLEAEMERLRQQRESLISEIRQMESSRLHYRTLTQQQASQQQMISEFLQALSGRLQETLTQQMAQSLTNLEAQFMNLAYTSQQTPPSASGPAYDRSQINNPPPLHPRERLEQLQMLQARSDQLLITLDSTICSVFETLQRNIHSYQESLFQGLEKIHNLGQQSEVRFTELVNQLSEQLQQEASTIMQSSSRRISELQSPPDATTRPQNPGNLEPRQFGTQAPWREANIAPFSPSQNYRSFSPNADNPPTQLPYPGIELPARSVELVEEPSPEANPTISTWVVQGQERSPSAAANSDEGLNPEMDISALNLDSLDDDDMKTLLQLNAVIPVPPETREDELDDFFNSLFGAEPVSDAGVEKSQHTAQEEGERGRLGATEKSPESITEPTTQSLEDALFAGLIDSSDEPTFVQPQTRPWENALFPEDWEATVFQIDTEAIAPIAADEQEQPSKIASRLGEEIFAAETNLAANSDVEPGDLVISSLADLFPEALTDESLSSAIETTVQETTQIQEIEPTIPQQAIATETPSLSLELEDTYIPASPDEDLLAIDASASQAEEFWLDQETLQLLSEDLFSFETPTSRREQQTEILETAQQIGENLYRLEAPDSDFFQQEEIFGTELTGELMAQEPFTQEELALEEIHRSENQEIHLFEETVADTALDEVLMEDWDDLNLDSFPEDVSAGVPNEQAQSQSEALHQEDSPKQPKRTEPSVSEWDASLYTWEPLYPPPDTVIGLLPPAKELTAEEEQTAVPENAIAAWELSETPESNSSQQTFDEWDEAVELSLKELSRVETENAIASDDEYLASWELSETPESNSSQQTFNEWDEAVELSLEELSRVETENAIPSDSDDEYLASWDWEETPESDGGETTQSDDMDWELELLRLEELIAPDQAIASPEESFDEAFNEAFDNEATLTSDDLNLDIPPSSDSEKKKQIVTPNEEAVSRENETDFSVEAILESQIFTDFIHPSSFNPVPLISPLAEPAFLKNLTLPDSVPPPPVRTDAEGFGVKGFNDGQLTGFDLKSPSSLILHALKKAASEDVSNYTWYLGIDFGTTGVSAVLLNCSTGERYPIYWMKSQQPESNETSFRLPSVTYIGPEGNIPGSSVAAIAVAPTSVANTKEGIFIQNFKPYLKVGIPYYSVSGKNWEPMLQWSLDQPISLCWIGRSLKALLATLTPLQGEESPLSSSEQAPSYLVGAAGLKPSTLNAAMSRLSGAIVGCPAQWGDTYRFNIREALLEAKLVGHPEQIFFLEDAIATVLAGIEGATLPEVPWRGPTLAINAGATTTELALVNLPENLEDLAHSDFACQSFAYAGNAIDQDIICQLLLQDEGSKIKDKLESSFILHSSSLIFPKPGEPDLATRDRLSSLLQSSPLGQKLLEAASYLKRILQHQESYTLELGEHSCVVTRQDLENRVFKPFIEQLNQKLNSLLIQTGIRESGIKQIICTGGTAAIGEIAQWLRQKLPKAILIRDTDTTFRVWSGEQATRSCSPVAYGLATLPLYPQLLEQQTQQYSDYFLLLELLRALPSQPLPVEEILQILEYRGINTRVCFSRVMALLDGQMPAGLVPSQTASGLLTPASAQNPDYQAIASAPLFEKEATQLYRMNGQQSEAWRRYLSSVLAGTQQKLDDPLAVNLLELAII